MSKTFTSYEAEWKQIKQSVESKLLVDCKQQSGEQKKATLRRVGMELEEAEEIVEQMEMEGKGKGRLMIIVRGCKAEIKNFRAAMQTESSLSDRDALLALPGHQAYTIDVDDSDIYPTSAAQRTRLLASTNTLGVTDSRLANSQRLAAETEDIGGNILETLRGQGAQLANSRDELSNADGSIAKATGTLKKMVRQMYKTRAMIWSFIIIFSLLICLVLWNKFR